MKKRTGEPWMAADAYGRGLRGVGINLLVPEIDVERPFFTEVIGAQEIYVDPDFAVFRGFGADWMLHADHTYDDHPLSGSLVDDIPRGVGAEFRVYGRDPDVAQAKADALGYIVLAGAMDKPHGLREAFIVSRSGYVWVPSVPTGGDA